MKISNLLPGWPKRKRLKKLLIPKSTMKKIWWVNLPKERQKNKAIEIAKSLLGQENDINIISSSTGLSLDELQKL